MIANVLRSNNDKTMIIVIDEIDSFEAHEKAFLTLARAILMGKNGSSA